ENRRKRIECVDGKRNLAILPILRNLNLALVPRRRDIAEPAVLPQRMRIKRLRILLHVIGNPRPRARNLEIAPVVRRRRRRLRIGGLPPPKAVDANALPRRRGFLPCAIERPDGFDGGGEDAISL